MKKRMKITCIILCGLLLIHSCSMIDFSEDCTYTGNVEVRFDWSNLSEGDKVPEWMDTRFYTPALPVRSFMLRGDTLLTEIVTGHYQVLAYNPIKGIDFIGLDNIETAIAQPPISEKDGKLYTVQAPLLYAAKTDIQVQPYTSTVCELIPKSCIRQLFVNFIVINEGFAEVENISGELSGVATGYSFAEMEAIRSTAILPFSSIKLSNGNFLSNLRVFGLNPSQEGQSEIQKEMYLSLQLSDGRIFNDILDLTGLFSDFTAASMYLTLEIRLTAMGMKISITDWYTIDQGIIEL
ncbi:uncharacterized protein DUF5119 [Dysgonomonas alginatilytica]|uniref:Uncharacterized protein DUF5119 n=1 Tax=Dysgonomonas alginatilytica TaxID=1605892 RepID=A0A2V3PMA7_9BACT|nr:DUF5119 domain-containing protein [Dysgonomonas alginatilytica]PXV61084.1 uncharacterized protein DUF5119 [Dysgonomonas alginatilytica]